MIHVHIGVAMSTPRWRHPLFDEGRPMMMTGSQQRRMQQRRWWRGGSLDDVDDAMLWSMAMKYMRRDSVDLQMQNYEQSNATVNSRSCLLRDSRTFKKFCCGLDKNSYTYEECMYQILRVSSFSSSFVLLQFKNSTRQ
jgi:hypothetical protein